MKNKIPSLIDVTSCGDTGLLSKELTNEDWIGKTESLTIEQIIERYGDELTEGILIKEKLAQYKQYKEELSAELKKYVQDKNNPLDERFEALIECPELSERSYRTNFNLDRFEDVVSVEYRYETYSVECIYNGLVDEFRHKEVLTPEEEITFKEYCCDNFISSMIFDW